MGFYGLEPLDDAKATYVWTGVGGPGFFSVEAWGEAPNFTTDVQLERDLHWVGGLKVKVMGWTGPLGKGTTPYRVRASFPGEYRDEIVVEGSNKTIVIKVGQIPAERAEDHMSALEAVTA